MKKKTKRILIGCGTLAAIVVVAIIAFGIFLAHSFTRSLEAVTDVSRYSEIKAMWPSNLVSHFPASAPESAAFFFQPGFLQGGSSLQLKVVMPASAVVDALHSYSPKTLATFHGGGWSDHANASNGIPTTHFFTSGNDSMDFPDDYVIMVTEADAHNGGFSWNHGRTCGLAVSTQRSTVVYWAEDW